MSLPVQLYTALFRQYGGDILRAKFRSISVYPGLFWFGHNLSLVNPQLQTRLWFKQIYIRASGTTYLPLSYKPTGPRKPPLQTRLLVQANLYSRHWYKSATTFYKPSGPSKLQLQTNLWFRQYLSKPLVQIHYHFLQTQWLKQTTTSNQSIGSKKLPLRTRGLIQTNHCLKPNNQTRPDQTRTDQDRPGHIPAKRPSTIYTAAIWLFFALARRESCI
jgi:hypothetical protein